MLHLFNIMKIGKLVEIAPGITTYEYERPWWLKYLFLAIGLAFIIFAMLRYIRQPNLIHPCPDEGCIIEPTPTLTPSPTITPTPTPSTQDGKGSLVGLASYYSREGCIGCSETLTMANGEPLDDSKLTVAYNRAPLNSYLTITNLNTGASVVARVTDTGGFERHGRIVDLSVATKVSLGCGDLCKVEVRSVPAPTATGETGTNHAAGGIANE